MKKFLSVFLVLCFLFLACSCNANHEVDPSGDSDTTKPADTTETVEESSDTEEEEETESEAEKEIKQIKNSVLNFKSTIDKLEDPALMFSYFDGDFELSNITNKTQTIQSMKRKGNTTVITCDASTKYYGIDADGFLIYARDSYQDVVLYGVLPLEVDAPEKSTIFTAFGIDTSTVYKDNDESNKDPELTAAMLTVSKDKKTCTFSEKYVDELVKDLAESLDYTDEQTEKLLKEYTGSCVYYVDENKLSFDIEFNDDSLGKVKMGTSLSLDKNQKFNVCTYMECYNSELGLTISQELNHKDIVYNHTNNQPISATIQLKTKTEMDNVNNANIKVTETETSTFKLDCSNEACPKANASYEKITSESYGSTTEKKKLTLSVSLDPSKTTEQLIFTERRDGIIKNSLSANEVSFGTPSSIASAPNRVTSRITDYINKYYK